MTPDEKKLLEDTSKKLDTFLDLYYRTNMIDKTVFPNKVYFNNGLFFKDGTIISSGGTVGMKIGSTASEKLGFFGTTPVDQPVTVSDPSGGVTVDSQARTAIIAVIDRLQELGLVA